jgi:hypothetical protein
MFENSVTYQLIGNVTNGGTKDSTLGKDIAAGSVALLKVADHTVQEDDETSTAGLFRFVQKTAGGQLIYSPEFEMSKATITSQVYVAPAEQVTYFGFNGTAGDLGTITSGSTYILSILLKNYAPGVGTTPLIKTIPYTTTAATQLNVATGLAASFERVFSREPYKLIQCDLVNSAAGADTSGGVFSVTNGSNVVTTVESAGAAADAGKYSADAGSIAVGDLIRFTAATEALTDPVYLVTAVSGIGTAAATITLDRKYTGATNASYAANAVGVIASGSIANFGFKFTGIDRFAATGFNPQTDFYSKTRFEVSSADFDDDVVSTLSVAASEGSGSAYEVAQLENFCAKNEGLGRVSSAYPPTATRTETDLATPGTYDTMVVSAYNNSMVNGVTGQQPVSKFTIVIRTKVALTGDDVDTALGVAV